MPRFTDGAPSDGVPEPSSRSFPVSASGERAPPTPGQIFVNLAILAVISLGFALAAQLVAG